MEGGKNWILPKEINANRFFLDSLIGQKSGQTTYVPLWAPMEGAWLWTQKPAVDKGEGGRSNTPPAMWIF